MAEGPSRRGLLAALGGLPLAAGRMQDPAPPANAQEPPFVLAQKALGSMACGPCAFYNSLKNAGGKHRAAADGLEGRDDVERVGSLIRRYGLQPSEVYRLARKRYDREQGTAPLDLEALTGDFLREAELPRWTGTWLDRQPQEERIDQLMRVRALFEAAPAPPIIELRSFRAEVEGMRVPLWEGLFGHFLSVLRVEPWTTDPRPSGFLMHCADSATGKVIPVFAAIESFRPYTATRGFTVNGQDEEQWRWVKDSPYLVVAAPDLRLRTHRAKWYERSVVAMTWALIG